MGGVSTVVRGYQEGGLFERFQCRYVVTHRDGTPLEKAATALLGWARTFVELWHLDAPLVHIHLSSRASFWRKSVIVLIAVAMRRPYMLHVHGSEFMKFYDEECGPTTRAIIRRVFAGSALVLALSEEWRTNLLRICPKAKIEVLTNAVSLPPAEATRHSGNTPAVVLFLGRLGRRKGVFDLVAAFSETAPRHPDALLVCAGDGAREEVLDQARQLGISDRVQCPGWMSISATREALSKAAVLALPSYAEGLPMAILEAMSWGLPVIATPVGGIPQVIKHDTNGLLVPPGDVSALALAISRMLTDTAARERLGAEARRTIERTFSLDACLERLASIYRRFGIPSRTAPV
jgi:glycosyltransferase involved in cell wall biosynthesis